MSDTKKLLVGSCALFVLCVALALLNALGLASPSLLFYGWLLAAAGGALVLCFAIARAVRDGSGASEGARSTPPPLRLLNLSSRWGSES